MVAQMMLLTTNDDQGVRTAMHAIDEILKVLSPIQRALVLLAIVQWIADRLEE